MGNHIANGTRVTIAGTVQTYSLSTRPEQTCICSSYPNLCKASALWTIKTETLQILFAMVLWLKFHKYNFKFDSYLYYKCMPLLPTESDFLSKYICNKILSRLQITCQICNKVTTWQYNNSIINCFFCLKLLSVRFTS